MAGFVDKFKRMWDAPDEEYEYDEYGYGDNEEEDVREDRVESRSSQRNKVININATAKLAVALFKPERFGEETRAIADELLKTHTVVLNLENTNRDMSRRIIDFLSGVAYANGGKIKKVASSTFIIIPNNVDLTGDDLLDELENNGVYF
ncbi:MAG: cell division protein SepF [Ruminococcaceae bacterium]|nr:cell division protein SepF [Oscillospiraceae bacterium]